MKTVCPVHRFAYSGNVCPFCEKERIAKLSQKYVSKKYDLIEPKDNAPKQLTDEDIQKLKLKFNC